MMSRNLLSINCARCGGFVKPEEDPRPITSEEAGRYYEEYEGMLVANGLCVICGAKYLGWVDETTRTRAFRHARKAAVFEPFIDLSYRSTFNDEPSEDDLPLWNGPERTMSDNKDMGPPVLAQMLGLLMAEYRWHGATKDDVLSLVSSIYDGIDRSAPDLVRCPKCLGKKFTGEGTTEVAECDYCYAHGRVPNDPN